MEDWNVNERERLAADLSGIAKGLSWPNFNTGTAPNIADRLIALGWTRLDEERLARALWEADGKPDPWDLYGTRDTYERQAAAIARAYREDAG